MNSAAISVPKERWSHCDPRRLRTPAALIFKPHAGHKLGMELGIRAVHEGREFVIAAGGDATINVVAQGLAGSHTVLRLMPLGSIMNVARTRWIPRDLPGLGLDRVLRTPRQRPARVAKRRGRDHSQYMPTVIQ
jgi:diacylglycerol kinase family enzyme